MTLRGVMKDQSEIARIGHVTPARLSQIMGMLSLAPEIQEAILMLPRVDEGHDMVTERGYAKHQSEFGLGWPARSIGAI